ncbi:S9 family peptidase [Asticcacaulis sp. AC466]|uniref:S9 family peptidase n=1 Tax=Asticcacaulis sp. AC466 TaxID=1282362 RepID=UPI0003F7D186|nr:S9 family peptidase [Asticcacaulis sp. AC466]
MSLIAFFAAVALSQAVPATDPILHRYDGLALSPDGARIVTIDSRMPVGKPSAPHGILTLRNAAGKVTGEADPCTTCRYSDPAWSPDGSQIAFLAADGKAGTATLYVLKDGQPRIVTTLKGVAAKPRWSPDGSTIALLAVENARKQVGATQAGAARVGEIGAATATDEQRIATVPAAGGTLSFVSPDDTWVYEYNWTPDGKGFVATAAKGDGDNNWWTAKLEYFGPGTERVIAAPKTQINMPRVSPDGASVLYIGGLMSDFGSIGGDVYTVPLTGGEPRNLTPDYPATFTGLTVTRGGVMATVTQGGETGIARIDPVRGGVSQVSVSAVGTMAGDGRVAFDAAGKTAAAVVESFTKAPAIHIGKPGALKAVTTDNDALSVPFTAQNVTWRNDGFNVQGWLLTPAGLDPAKKHPMITIIHGGPSAAVTPRFSSSGTAYDLLKAGYLVFQPNPRGSYGQGEAFVLSNRRDFGGGDLRDILAGIDAVEKLAPVDDARLGVTGGSYGGFMTMWTVTQTNRFKAGAAGAGIANWISYYGQNGIDQWMIPFFGASAYDDPAIYDKLSPIRYIKNAKTPTFVYVGERDIETPAAQSLEFWHGLKAQGVDTTLMIYEGEGHSIRKPENSADLAKRIVAWFDKYLK